ncbi:MAG TPA: ABC transporter ATP-binding protein [Polyangiaceae bacterium]|nr:ABC transporter ATP-binding protein [Polyangiaceae bacterium]
MSAGMTAAVSVRSARKRYGERFVLDQFDLEIDPGEFVALLGKSGSGKTTLLRVLSGLEQLTEGQALVPSPCTVVFQEPRLIESKRVLENVGLGLPATPENLEAARRALVEVELESHVDAWPTTLSGGEAQRVSLARALLREPKLLLLDEPFAALDALTRLKMQALVARLCARHRPAVLLVTHDVDEAILLADRVLVLAEGRVALTRSIELPRPRSRGGAAVDELRQALLAALGVHE